MDKKYIQETGNANLWSDLEANEKIGNIETVGQNETKEKQGLPTDKNENINHSKYTDNE